MIRLFRRKAKEPRNRGFCSRCEFHSARSGNSECLRPTTKRRSPIDGSFLDVVARPCESERADEAPTACGPFGRFFSKWDCGW